MRMASPQCCTNPPALNPAGGEGRVVDGFGGIAAYVAGSTKSKAAVILISDIFGNTYPLDQNSKMLLSSAWVSND